MKWILLLILLVGCIEQDIEDKKDNKDEVVKGGLEQIAENKTISNRTPEQQEENQNEIIDWGDVDIPKDFDRLRNYTYEKDLPAYVYFFNVGYREKQGRLILIKKGTLDIYIWSVPNETYAKALSKIKSSSDDVEYLIIPSLKPLNLETLNMLKQDIAIGEIWAPRELEDARVLSEKDTFILADMEIMVLKAGIPFSRNINDSSLILKIKNNEDCILLLLDAETGLIKELNRDYMFKFSCKYMEWGDYGIFITQDLYQSMFNYYGIKHLIADGSSYDPGSRTGIFKRAEPYKIEISKVWENDTVVVLR